MSDWGDLAWLRTYSEALWDAKKNRAATDNRITRGGAGDLLHGQTIIDTAWQQERQCEEFLMAEYAKVVPERVRQWAATVPGLSSGELFPRILGAIGHPRIATPERWEGKVLVPDGDSYPRSLRQLWQYCGCGDPERRPHKNATREEKLSWGKRTVVRPLLFTWTSSLVRNATPGGEHTRTPGQPRSETAAGSEFWSVFAKARMDAAGHGGNCDKGKWPAECSATHRWHDHQCKNRSFIPEQSNGCGTVAHPEWGEAGSPWRPKHILMHAHRLAQKELLRRLWIISR